MIIRSVVIASRSFSLVGHYHSRQLNANVLVIYWILLHFKKSGYCVFVLSFCSRRCSYSCLRAWLWHILVHCGHAPRLQQIVSALPDVHESNYVAFVLIRYQVDGGEVMESAVLLIPFFTTMKRNEDGGNCDAVDSESCLKSTVSLLMSSSPPAATNTHQSSKKDSIKRMQYYEIKVM